MTSRSRRLVRPAAAVVPLALLVTLAGCGSSGDDANTAGDVAYPTVEFSTPGEGISLGHDDQEIGDTIPEPLHVAEIDPIRRDQLVAVAGGFGKLELGVNVLDPKTGVAGSRIVVGPGIWDPVIHGFVGETPSDPAVLAAEVWRPRGSRGAADFTVSTYSGNLLEPAEALLPDVARVHSRPGSNAVTSDGRYFVTWDDGLYGVRVVDLETKQQSGAVQIVGCGPFTWTVDHEIYSVCEETGELIRISVGDDGVPAETARAKVLPEDFVSARKVGWAAEARKALLVGENGDVYVFDFSNGLPQGAVTPIGNAGQPDGRFASDVIDNTGTRIAIAYTDSPIHPSSARGGDLARIVLSDAANLAPIRSLNLQDLGLTDIASMAFSVDGATFYVLGGNPEGQGEAAQRIVGFDAATGQQVSSAEISGNVEDFTDLLTPEVIG
ncbi:hypothetical protein [Rhodococcus aetherivorans]|uniref:hypothetical protein n=1 Tax=Rhodococcus aetherivorans TaxID=191292 RepID=UPI0038905C12